MNIRLKGALKNQERLAVCSACVKRDGGTYDAKQAPKWITGECGLCHSEGAHLDIGQYKWKMR